MPAFTVGVNVTTVHGLMSNTTVLRGTLQQNLLATNATTNNYTKGSGLISSSFAVTFFLCIVVIVSFFGNSLVLVTFRISNELNHVSDYFIINLAISDLTVTLFSIPFWMSYVLIGWPNNQSGPIYTIWICLDIFCGCWSIMSLAIISLERYFCIVHPMKYESIVTRQRGMTVVCFVLVYSFVASLLGYLQAATRQAVVSMGIIVLAYVIPIIIKGFTYGKIYKEVKKQSKFMVQVEKDRRRLLATQEGTYLEEDCSEANTPIQTAKDGKSERHEDIRASTVERRKMVKKVSCVRHLVGAKLQRLTKRNRQKFCCRSQEGRQIACSQLQKDGIEDWEAYMDELERQANQCSVMQNIGNRKMSFDVHELASVDAKICNDYKKVLESSKRSEINTLSKCINRVVRHRHREQTVTLDDSSPRQATKICNAGKLPKSGNRSKISSKRFKKETKGAKVIGAIIGTFLMLWTPFILIVLLSSISMQVSIATIMAVKCLHYANSAINPILYVVLNITLRNEVKKVLAKAGVLNCTRRSL